MSCGPEPITFRLLDALVGWDPDGTPKGLTGLSDPAGLRLALISGGGAVVDPNDLLPYFPPARLARGCDCRWYLVRNGSRPALLERGPCLRERDCWVNISAAMCGPRFVRPIAVATSGRRVAVSDAGAREVSVLSRGSWRIRAVLRLEVKSRAGRVRRLRPGPVAFFPDGELLVATRRGRLLFRFGPAGDLRGRRRAPGHVVRIAIDADCAAWIVTRDNGTYRLWRAKRGEPFQPASLEDAAALPSSGVVGASSAGFCLGERDAGGLPARRCYDWSGCPIDAGAVQPAPPPAREKKGQLLTTALDSGIPHCRWHRVRVDADVPFGTSLAIAVASTGDPTASVQGQADPGWQGFPAGSPHPTDWREAPRGSLDFLVDQPPGRYLFVRLRLTGDGRATPVVRRVRIDLPRSTSLEYLPDVYRANPEAEDFTERFLALFDATVADLDRAIERYPAFLDVDGVPDDVVPWLAGFLDIVCDTSWSPKQRREIVRKAPELFRQRGTVAGLKLAIALAAGVAADIEELPLERLWGGLGRKRRRGGDAESSCTGPSQPVPASGSEARLRSVRLFARARARFRLSQSTLGGAPIRSYGNPDMDPIDALAYRFRVLVPSAAPPGSAARERLERLVTNVKPAHTIATLRTTANAFVVGPWSLVGVDTGFHALPAPVLGPSGNVRLNRASVLWPGPSRRAEGFRVGPSATVGINSVMQ